MKIVFFINTPGQVHWHKNTISSLIDKGHRVKIFARDIDEVFHLLDNCGLKYSVYIKPKKRGYGKILDVVPSVLKACKLAKGFRPDILIGFGIVAALTSVLLRKPCLIFNDNDPTVLQNFLSKSLASVFLTPSCFRKDLGKKQIRFAGYKELAYLHPNYFTPDPSVYDELGINKDEKYVILRFNAFDAFHDIGRRGFSLPDKYQLVNELKKYARIFISAEGDLPQDLRSYKLPIPFHRIHYALYYAHMLICDTGTMAWEAGVLGVPAITCGSFVTQFGNFIELEQKYRLIYCFQEFESTLNQAMELIKQPNLKQGWAKKRQRLLNDKIDVTKFMVWFIENYPQSFEECRCNQTRKASG